MYNLTYVGNRVTLLWLDPRSNFDLDLSRSNYTWFDAPWRDKHDGIKIVALPLKLKILSSKNRFGKFWNFDPWWPQFWPEPKNDRNDFEMIFRELSIPVFRFVLRCAGAEIDGGCSNTPPPPAGGGKYRGPAGRGLRDRSFHLSPKCHPTFHVQSKENMPKGNLRVLFSYTVLSSVNYSFLVLKKGGGKCEATNLKFLRRMLRTSFKYTPADLALRRRWIYFCNGA